MKRSFIRLAVMFCLAGAAVLIGCSKNSNSSSNNTITGNVNDSSFAAIVNVNDGASELHIDDILLTFRLTGYISQDASPRAIGASLATGHGERTVELYGQSKTYNAASGWHVVTVDSIMVSLFHYDGANESVERKYFKGIDSLRFTDTSGAFLDTPLTVLNIRKIESRSAFHIFGPNAPDVYDTASFTIAGNLMSTFMLNGTTHGTVVQAGTAAECGMNGHFTQTFADVPLTAELVYISRDCPATGSVSLNITLSADCSGGAEPDSSMPVGTWTVSMSFNGGQKYITASNGTTSWSEHGWCGPNPTDLTASDTAFVEDTVGGGQLGAFLYDIPVAGALINTLPAKVGRDFVPSAVAQLFDSIEVHVVSHSYTNQWHIFNFTAYLMNLGGGVDTTSLEGTDSVRIYENGVVVQTLTNPDSLSGLDTRLHAGWYKMYPNNDGSGVLHHRTNYTAVDVGGQKLAQGSGTVVDTAEYYPSDSSGHCNVFLASSQQITNLTFDPGMSGCPVSGRIDASSYLEMLCYGPEDDHINANGDWTVTAVANGDGTVTLTYSNGHTSWSKTGPCN